MARRPNWDRLLLTNSSWIISKGKNVVIEVAMAKYWTTDMAFRVADRCLQLFGGYGYCEEYPIARAWGTSA